MNRQPHAHRDVPPALWPEIVAVLAEGAVLVVLVVASGMGAIATVVGLWVALVVVLTGGPS